MKQESNTVVEDFYYAAYCATLNQADAAYRVVAATDAHVSEAVAAAKTARDNYDAAVDAVVAASYRYHLSASTGWLLE